MTRKQKKAMDKARKESQEPSPEIFVNGKRVNIYGREAQRRWEMLFQMKCFNLLGLVERKPGQIEGIL